MFNDILVNIMSDVLFLLGTVVIGWLIFVATPRTKLLKFFGLKEQKRLVIYVSNLQIRPSIFNIDIAPSGILIQTDQSSPGGAFGIDGELRSFRGSATVFSEISASNRYKELFNFFIPSLSDRSNVLGTILLSDVKVVTLISPLSDTEIETSSTVISLGGPAYNAMSSYIERHLNSQVSFSDENSEFIIRGIPPFRDMSYVFIERLIDKDNNRKCFYIAGLSEESTLQGAEYLALQWNTLRKKYGDEKPFIIVLRFEKIGSNKWSIILER